MSQIKTKRKQKRFRFPAGSRHRSIVLRELDGADELLAAETAAALLPKNANGRQVVVASQREATKIAIVEIDGAAVDHTVPLFAVNSWSRKDLAALDVFFGSMNGLTDDEVRTMYGSAAQLSDGSGRYGTGFLLPPGCGLTSVEVWETSADDEINAAREMDGINTIGIPDLALRQRRALVGRALVGRAPDWQGWSMRTSTAISLCYQKVNSIPEGELEGLVAAAEEVGETVAETSSPTPAEAAEASP